MLEYSLYSVISPEGCASILFRDAKLADKAAQNLKITSKDITQLGIADGVVKEPLGGAHYNWQETADAIKKVITKDLNAYKKTTDIELFVEERYQKFRQMGQLSVHCAVNIAMTITKLKGSVINRVPKPNKNSKPPKHSVKEAKMAL
jgi:acetyl-CoA carboxylase carboxyl transferase subunit alpha